MGCWSCNNEYDLALLSGTMSKSYNNEYKAPTYVLESSIKIFRFTRLHQK